MLLPTVVFVLALAVNKAPALQVTPEYAENIDNKDSVRVSFNSTGSPGTCGMLGSRNTRRKSKRHAWSARIVSGWQAHPGQFPHMVSMRMVNKAGTVQGCGGSVMSREWILTAAHCTATQITLLIRAGVTSLTRPELFTESQEYYMYPTFNPTTPQLVQPNDIAVVKLPFSLSYSQYLKPIRIQSSADAYRSYENLVTVASGFGRTWTNGPQTEQLLWVYLRGVSNPSCAGLFTTSFVTDNTVCARFYNVTSQSICQGDSGGPLVHMSSKNEPILIGVSSFVANAPHGCHSGLPAAFIRPGPFHSWFTQITGIDFENLKEDDETTTTSSTSTGTTTTTTSTPVQTTTTTTTFAPSTTTTQRPTSTTVTVPVTTVTTLAPSTTTKTTVTVPVTTVTTLAPSTTTNTSVTVPVTTVTTLAPSTTTNTSVTVPVTTVTTLAPSTTTNTTVTIPVTNVTTLAPPTTTPITNTTTPNPEEEDIDDPELEELLKRLEVKVKVKVRLSKYLKKKKQIT